GMDVDASAGLGFRALLAHRAGRTGSPTEVRGRATNLRGFVRGARDLPARELDPEIVFGEPISRPASPGTTQDLGPRLVELSHPVAGEESPIDVQLVNIAKVLRAFLHGYGGVPLGLIRGLNGDAENQAMVELAQQIALEPLDGL